MRQQCHCPLCGVIAQSYMPDVGDALDEFGGSEWTADIRILAIDKERTSLERAWLSRPVVSTGNSEIYTYVSAEDGDESFAPYEGDPKYDKKDLLFPVHSKCLEQMFSQVLHTARPELDGSEEYGAWHNVNLQLLYDTLAYLWAPEYRPNMVDRCLAPRCLNIDYGPGTTDADYIYEDKLLEFAADPTFFETLLDSYQTSSAGDIAAGSESVDYSSDLDKHVTSTGGLLSLPTDILCEISFLLPCDSAQSLRLTCKWLRNTLRGNWYWSRRVLVDYAFLSNWLLEYAKKMEMVPNWRQIYKDLANMSTHKSQHRILNLVSRRRIWNVCWIISREYFHRQSIKNLRKELSNSQKGLIVRHFPTVSWPVASEPSGFRILLADELKSNLAGQMRITVSYNAANILSYIWVDREMKVENFTEPSASITQECFEVEAGDEITSLELTMAKEKDGSKVLQIGGVVGVVFHWNKSGTYRVGITNPEEGPNGTSHCAYYKRLLGVANGYRAVGIRGTKANGVIHQLGLIEQEVSRPAHAHEQSAAPIEADHTASIQDWMWHARAPEYHTLLSPAEFYSAGTNYSNTVFPTIPQEHMRVDGIAHIARISVNFMLGLEIEYHTAQGNKVCSIGPRLTPDELKLDFEHGERLERVGVPSYSYHYCTFRFVTNWQRQLDFGQDPERECRLRWKMPPPGYNISGFFGSWVPADRTIPELPAESKVQRPLTFGVMFTPSFQTSDTGLQPGIWEPEPAPANWFVNGPSIPEDLPMQLHGYASWLDFSLPCKAVDLCFAHCSPNIKHLVLAGLTLYPSDRRHTTVGLISEPFANRHLPEERLMVCTCKQGKNTCGCGPSWQSIQWSFPEARIQEMRLWTAGKLTGLQLVLDNGQESPVWGSAQDSQVSVITFGEAEAKGVKIFFDLSTVARTNLGAAENTCTSGPENSDLPATEVSDLPDSELVCNHGVCISHIQALGYTSDTD